MSGKLILGQDRSYSLDCFETGLNNNVLVVGTSGSGKTRSVITPNLLEAEGSYIISDPKGNLHQKYEKYLKQKGYIVRKLDFTKPLESDHYNFFHYIRNTRDIMKVAHMLIYQDNHGVKNIDPFWDQAAELLVQACIAFLREQRSKPHQDLHHLLHMIEIAQCMGDMTLTDTPFDRMFEEIRGKDSSFSYSQYRKFRVAADRTLRSILITANAKLGIYDVPEINEMTKKNDFEISELGNKKMAVFVVVSDTDRSMDNLVNLFFTQAMNELCQYADRYMPNSALDVPVRFILDDFATNCKIVEFPRMISSIRSRNISVMLSIQAEEQLTSGYGNDAGTIISNCDSYVYLGGNDVPTAEAVAKRCDLPLKKILNMPVGMSWVFRRGQDPQYGRNYDPAQCSGLQAAPKDNSR